MNIHQQLEMILQRFEPLHLEIVDESHKHKHFNNGQGESHYKIILVSDLFNNKTRLQRHKMVHLALEDLLRTQIHALILKLYNPQEYEV